MSKKESSPKMFYVNFKPENMDKWLMARTRAEALAEYEAIVERRGCDVHVLLWDATTHELIRCTIDDAKF